MPTPSSDSLSLDEALSALESWPSILSAREAARASGLSVSTIRRRVASGELRVLRSRWGSGGRLRFLKQDVARLLVAMAG